MADTLITTNDFLATHSDGDNVRVPHTNANNITLNVDQNAGIKLAELVLAPGFERALGAAGNPVLINATIVKMFGSGGLWYKADDGGGASEVTDTVLVRCGRADTPVEFDSAAATGNTWQNIYLLKGAVAFAATFKWHASANLHVGGAVASDITVTLNATAALPMLVAERCFIISQTPLTAGTLCVGGTLRQTAGVIAFIDIGSGGRLELNHTAATSIIVQPGGTLDLTQTEAFKTIETLHMLPGAILISNGEPNQAGGPTVTNLIDLRND